MNRNMISEVIQSNDKRSHEVTRLIQVLLGISQPSARISVAALTFFDPSLNASQKEAVKFALEAPEVACIHGPPGGCIV
jgi:DNA polymerase alpha-associated DNA helicase A